MFTCDVAALVMHLVLPHSCSNASRKMETKSGKRKRWTEDVEDVLIDIWAKRIEEIKSERKNMQIYAEMSLDLEGHGVFATPIEIKKKLETLKRKFFHEKIASRGNWIHYDKVSKILSALRISQVKDYEDSNNTINSVNESDISYSTDDSRASFNESFSKKKRSNYIVSDTSKEKEERKRICWSEDAEKKLIDIWAAEIDVFQSRPNKKCIYKKIAQKLAENGSKTEPTITADEIKVKLELFEQRYVQEAAVADASAEALSNWVHYEKIGSVLSASKLIKIEEHEDEDSTFARTANKSENASGNASPTIINELKDLSSLEDSIASFSESSSKNQNFQCSNVSLVECEANKDAEKRKCWTQRMEMKLIDIWADRLNEFGKRKHKNIYADMAQDLANYGAGAWSLATSYQIKMKCDTLKRKYYQQEALGKTRSGWVFYDKLASILSSSNLSNFEKCFVDESNCFSGSESAGTSRTNSPINSQEQATCSQNNKTPAKNIEFACSRIEEANLTASETAQSLNVLKNASIENNEMLRVIACNQEGLTSVIKSGLPFGESVSKEQEGDWSKVLLSRLDQSNRLARDTAQSVKLLSNATIETTHLLRVIATNQKELINLKKSQMAKAKFKKKQS